MRLLRRCFIFLLPIGTAGHLNGKVPSVRRYVLCRRRCLPWVILLLSPPSPSRRFWKRKNFLCRAVRTLFLSWIQVPRWRRSISPVRADCRRQSRRFLFWRAKTRAPLTDLSPALRKPPFWFRRPWTKKRFSNGLRQWVSAKWATARL